ncbi:MAG: Rne/Rng family ribonuclease [Bacteroidales bacterium]|nr:Rne/Rng family ribonuclease [Bacteroidales bacterium]
MTDNEITKELIITSHPNEVQIALLEDKRLVEIHRETSSDCHSIGDIYLGTVRKIMPGLNAAFVDVGSEKDAFLHYLDLGSNARTINEFVSQAINYNKRSIAKIQPLEEVEKNGKIGNVLTSGQKILVQVAKEAISTKGPRVTTEISFAGRYLVLVPFMDKINVSQKIKSSQERKRLKKIVQGIKPHNFGIIIRTVAKDKTVEDLSADLQQLKSRWDNAVNKLFKAEAPIKIADELDKTSALIRDMVNDSFNAIYIDSQSIYREVVDYLHSFSSEKTDIVKFYNEKQPIFEHFNVAKQIKGSFGKVVTIKNGVYLIIEHTEAMHVIDVNSGNRVKSSQSPEDNAFDVNLIAAQEIARQLRLRDMGGIITIDFIDMHDPAHKSLLFKKMQEFMANDKARHTILPLNKFGLLEITRQRVKEATIIETTEQCPACHGTGKIKPAILLQEELENTLEFLMEKQGEQNITIGVHPFVYAYLTKGLPSIQVKWFFRFKNWIHLKSNQSYYLTQFKFFNKDMDEIMLWSTPTEN